MTPSPKAAPIRPIAAVRLPLSVKSAIIAWAVGRVALDRMPPRKRAPTSKPKSRLPLRTPRRPRSATMANSPKLSEKPMRPITSTGLRPMRSERAPQIGLKTNCIKL